MDSDEPKQPETKIAEEIIEEQSDQMMKTTISTDEKEKEGGSGCEGEGGGGGAESRAGSQGARG